MPLPNRVTPDGKIVAAPQRGTMLGNRGGAFHTPQQTIEGRLWHSKQWICCVLAFKNRRREVMQPRRYTELFFLDEATALAAGHRPCFECRRDAAMDFALRWSKLRGGMARAVAGDMDKALHAERLDGQGNKRLHQAEMAQLPDNTFIRWNGQFTRITGPALQVWSFDGYGPPLHRPDDAGRVDVLTPPSIVAVLGDGYRPLLHKSAAS
jgi:hypothetical protein